MPETVWYQSLYWRIALGFVALLATLLAVQGLVFLWLTGRMAEFLPGRSPAELAQAIAADVAAAIAERPDIDLDAHLNTRFTQHLPFLRGRDVRRSRRRSAGVFRRRRTRRAPRYFRLINLGVPMSGGPPGFSGPPPPGGRARPARWTSARRPRRRVSRRR